MFLLLLSAAANAQSLGVKGLYDQAVLILAKLNDSVDVFLQDQTTGIVDYCICKPDQQTTLTVDASAGDTVLNVVDTTGVDVGNVLTVQKNAYITQAVVQSTTATTITLNVPLDTSYSIGDVVVTGSYDMNVDGSVTTQVFRVKPPLGVKWDITRLLMTINDDATMDDGKFGGLTALTKGILFRSGNGTLRNIFWAKTNGELALRAYDVAYIDGTLGPSGQEGLRFRRSFGGQDKNGVVIRLDGDAGDALEILVQDDLRGLTGFRAIAQGHVVEE